MFAQAAALLFFVTKTLRDREPLQRFFELAIVSRDDPRESRRELRPHRDFAFAFVLEIEKLRDDLRSALLCIEFGRFEDGPVPFDKSIAPRHLAPSSEDVIPLRGLIRQKIAKSGKSLHLLGANAAARFYRHELKRRSNKCPPAGVEFLHGGEHSVQPTKGQI